MALVLTRKALLKITLYIITICFLMLLFKGQEEAAYPLEDPVEYTRRDVPLSNATLIIVVTPTYARVERLADMTRLSQTLSHIKNLYWVVVEDGDRIVDAVSRLLDRSSIPYAYMSAKKHKDYPEVGVPQRNVALAHIRQKFRNYTGSGVVYFADDDNAYDIRLFDEYIRNVKTIGIWAVGLAGGAYVEAPIVKNKTIVAWHAIYAPNRTFAVDMAAFAVNLRLILQTNISFAKGYPVNAEVHFLDQFNITKEQVEPFGYDRSPKEILVWHVKTTSMAACGDTLGYVVERPSAIIDGITPLFSHVVNYFRCPFEIGNR